MLIYFEYGNYRSFLYTASLSLKADSIDEFKNTVVEENSLQILPVAAVFGANGSGKSNLITAFNFLKGKVLEDISEKVSPFLFTHERQNSYFSIKFTISNDRIVYYHFSLDYQGRIVSERLDVEEDRERKRIFTRQRGVSLNKGLKKYEKNIENELSESTLLLNILKNVQEESIDEIYHWFEEVDVVTFSNSFDKEVKLKEILDDPASKNALLSYLDSTGFTVEDIFYSSAGFFTVRCVDNKKVILPLKEESGGVIKMIELFYYLSKSLKHGTPLFIDDLDSKLHPLLLRYIVVNFTNKELNPNHAQLIFTSNDYSLLNINLLRRDEIWFVEKNNNISELYLLSDFYDSDERVKKEDFLNSYFLGQFGAIPVFKDVSILELDNS